MECCVSNRHLLLVISLLLVGSGGCSQQPARQARAASEGRGGKPLPVTATPAKLQSARRTIEVTGTLLAYESVVVSSQLDGVVSKILADLGDRVQQNKPLAELDRAEFEIQLKQASASLQQALARLGLKPGEDPQSVTEEHTVDVMRAQAALDEADIHFRRVKNLHELQIGTQQAVDQADAALKTAQANYRASIDQVRTLKAQIEQDRAAVELAKKKLNDTVLRAPFAGDVQQRFISPGQYVKVQERAFSLVQTNPLRLRAEVAERFVRSIREGQEVRLSVEGLKDNYTARITRVSPAVTEQSRTLLVEAVVDNSRQLLRPGLFARAVIVSDHMENVLLAPASAVINYYGINKVFSIAEGTVRERPVKLGDRFGEDFEILGGVQPGEVLATSNLEKLTMGLAVQVTEGRRQ